MILRFTSFALAAGVLAAQPFPTHVVMDLLLRIRFYPASGGFSMDSPIPVLFPPPGETPARLLIKKSGGGTVVAKEVVIRP